MATDRDLEQRITRLERLLPVGQMVSTPFGKSEVRPFQTGTPAMLTGPFNPTPGATAGYPWVKLAAQNQVSTANPAVGVIPSPMNETGYNAYTPDNNTGLCAGQYGWLEFNRQASNYTFIPGPECVQVYEYPFEPVPGGIYVQVIYSPLVAFIPVYPTYLGPPEPPPNGGLILTGPDTNNPGCGLATWYEVWAEINVAAQPYLLPDSTPWPDGQTTDLATLGKFAEVYQNYISTKSNLNGIGGVSFSGALFIQTPGGSLTQLVPPGVIQGSNDSMIPNGVMQYKTLKIGPTFVQVPNNTGGGSSRAVCVTLGIQASWDSTNVALNSSMAGDGIFTRTNDGILTNANPYFDGMGGIWFPAFAVLSAYIWARKISQPACPGNIGFCAQSGGTIVSGSGSGSGSPGPCNSGSRTVTLSGGCNSGSYVLNWDNQGSFYYQLGLLTLLFQCSGTTGQVEVFDGIGGEFIIDVTGTSAPTFLMTGTVTTGPCAGTNVTVT
jgi:hypothetical protein